MDAIARRGMLPLLTQSAATEANVSPTSSKNAIVITRVNSEFTVKYLLKKHEIIIAERQG